MDTITFSVITDDNEYGILDEVTETVEVVTVNTREELDAYFASLTKTEEG